MEKRLIPVNIFDTTTVEQWLEQMAEEGFILNSFKGRKAVFEDGHCQKIKYRFIPLEDKDEAPSKEMRELFEENGWNFVTTVEKFFFVFSNDTEFPKPIPFSKEEERRIYEDLKGKKRNSMLLAVLGFFVLVGFQLGVSLYFRLDDYILGNEINTGYAYILAIFLNIMAVIREYRSYAILKRRLESMEMEEEEDSPYMPTTKWIRVETVLQVFAFILMLVPLLSEFNGANDPVTITENELPVSYVSLEEIESAIPGMEYFNRYTYMSKKTSLLAPVQYIVEQGGTTYNDADENVIGDEPHLSFSYIELKYSELGNVALHSLMRLYHTTKVEQEGLDQAWVEKSENRAFIFLLKDNKILKIKYWGEADILSHLDSYIAIMQSSAS
ncbi:hypothetical protein CLNEO_06230 [Anaerotignum neopropionicum]|uniref:DUF2812 domain-containing protein n=1 Tax=Anaerotignum neopropionicum TaxID=36847 RepID=A0A136WIW9_9FIRM|nr:DUF2812 domain-containing protein [Anaerotignum neopropionicum]KXL54516.1 hypothetical protein CLNEO_06230 [Anaerotignum neopropionicum]